jgi:hypothetical protein
MRTANLANQAQRHTEVGGVWEERLTNASGTLSLRPFQTFRVRAAAAVTVTIDGTLAMTMASGEIAIFNTGSGSPGASPGNSQAQSVSVVVTGSAYVQVARDNVREN